MHGDPKPEVEAEEVRDLFQQTLDLNLGEFWLKTSFGRGLVAQFGRYLEQDEMYNGEHLKRERLIYKFVQDVNKHDVLFSIDLWINVRLKAFDLNFRFIYTGIRVRNMDDSLRFYTEILQMEVVEKLEKTEPTRGLVVTLKSKDSQQLLELNYYEEGSRFGTEYKNGEELDHLAFDVEDLLVTVGELKKQGVEIIAEPYSIGQSIGWKEAFVRDPNGIWIELLERKRND